MELLPGWIDRDDREVASFGALIDLADGRRVAATITNISNSGCQVEWGQTLPIGETVRISVAGAFVADATIRWSLLSRAGLRFNVPLDTV